MVKMTKKELIILLQNDNSPDNTPLTIVLECTNNDECIIAEITNITFDTRDKELILNGTYEEEY